VASQLPLLGNPGNWEELEQSYAALQTWLGGLSSSVAALSSSLALTPVGAVTAFAAATAPTGWLLCDGSAKSRATYSALFGIIGTTYGVGDGSTTFNLPDLRQRFPMGKAASGTGNTLGSTGGAIDHTHTVSGATGATAPGTDSQGSHSHTVNSHTHGVGTLGNATWSHVVAAGVAGGSLAVDGNQSQTFDTGATAATAPGTDSQGSHSHTVNSHTHAAGTLATGSANAPYQVVNYIVFAGV